MTKHDADGGSVEGGPIDEGVPVRGGLAPGLDEIEAMAQDVAGVIAEVFPAWADAVRAVVLRIEDLASPEVLAQMGIEDPFELTGLYDGVPLTMKSFSDQSMSPDVVWLYRRAILDEWIDRGDVELADLVANVVIHEFAHHFGWSDADIAAIDAWWE